MNAVARRLLILLLSVGPATWCGAPALAEAPSPDTLADAGIPLIRHFSLQEIDGTQVVDIAQDPRGLLYFSDYNNGLIEYDGEQWRQYELPDFAVAVEDDSEGRIWVAGPGQIGFMEPDELGNLNYSSLLEQLPEEKRGFSEVWPILTTSRGVFFMAREFLFRRHDGKFTDWPGTVDEIFYRGYEVDGRLFFAQLGVGLLELVDEQLRLVSGDLLAGSAEINAMFARGDGTSWVLTRIHGVFVFDGRKLKPVVTPASRWLIDQQVQHACRLPRGRIAVASRRGGIAILDSALRILNVLDESVGLSAAGISYVKTDDQDNLWATTDRGIDRIILDSSVVLFGPDSGLDGPVHTAIRHRDRLLIGTDLGLYVGDLDPAGALRFTAVPDLPSATWSLISAEDVVLAGTTDGIFEIRLSSSAGIGLSLVRRLTYDATQLIFRPEGTEDEILVALDNGVGRIHRQLDADGKKSPWSWAGRIMNLGQEIREFVEGKDGEILAWMPGQDEILILQFPEGLAGPPEVQTFPMEGSSPIRIDAEIVSHIGDEGYLRYLGLDASNWIDGRPFGPAPELDAYADFLLKMEDSAARRWIFGSQGVGLAQKAEGESIRFQPIAARPIDGFVNLFEDPLLKGTFWIGTADGLYRWTEQAETVDRPMTTALIRQVSLLHQDRILYGGGGRLDALPVLPFETNSLRFEFAAPIYDQQLPVQYQVRLDGFDTEWSPWSEESFKEYTNLKEGSYSFRVRALDSWGKVSNEGLFGFQILSPWYRTPGSYAGGFLLAIGLLFLGLRWRSGSERRERYRLESLIAARTEELEDGKHHLERQAAALEQANRQLAEENEHRRVLEAEREKLQVRVEQSQKLESLGLVAGGVAHDFNNILMAILGNADLALEDAAMDPTSLRSRLQEIRRASHRAAELCRHMLAYAGKGPIQKKELDLTTVALECLEMVRAGVSANVGFELDLLENPPAVLADGTQLRQVAMNLILNAVEALDPQQVESGSGKVRVTTGLRHLDPSFFQETLLADPLPGGPYAVLKVEDNGSGMDEATLKKIFDPFFTTKFTGRGLGLAATLGIVRSHDGAIKATSRPGQGTILEIYLPALDHGADPESQSGTGELRSWRKTGTVLVVDDEEIVRDVVSVMLRNTGFDVLVASSGDQALEIFAREFQQISAVIMDLTMPGADGQTTFGHMREIDPEVKVVLSSGYAGDDIVERYFEEGFAGFLHKPYRAGALRETLRKILEE